MTMRLLVVLLAASICSVPYPALEQSRAYESATIDAQTALAVANAVGRDIIEHPTAAMSAIHDSIVRSSYNTLSETFDVTIVPAANSGVSAHYRVLAGQAKAIPTRAWAQIPGDFAIALFRVHNFLASAGGQKDDIADWPSVGISYESSGPTHYCVEVGPILQSSAPIVHNGTRRLNCDKGAYIVNLRTGDVVPAKPIC